MKKKIYIILMILVISGIIYGYKQLNSNKSIDDVPIETISCTLNDKVYSFDIFFDDDNLVYKAGTNDSLIIPFVYKTEEEISNMITSIFANKGAVCSTNSSYDIEIDF